MADTIFNKRLHITELITAVMALTFHMVGLNGLFLDQHIDGIRQLDLITRSRRRFSQQRPDFSTQDIATYNSKV